ncbi:glycosyltransferase family 4 protein [Methanosphaera sp. ISO3-F5]|uniref:glycosyltransferase family 4 protein n=1 Tax=Methanosphaera sp. ISO3-F5 TaxID=1452353 RepID=UPI002B2644AE|nr:glycosyltransferase family 4 protein [Methanosphaera sp. ISO3-F5]WQH64967.1 glycosyltransferase family 4 protein [Methanosphaera sp. ISO3-F5]
MRICFVSNLYPPNVLGGAEIVVEKMANAMNKRGHTVIVITTSPDDSMHILKEEGITVYQLNTTRLYPTYKQTEPQGVKKPLWHVFDLWNNKTLNVIKEILVKESIDIVHINNFKGLSLSCFKSGKDLDIPVVYESHDFSLICPRANLIRGNNTLCQNRNVICNEYVRVQRKLLSDNVDLVISPSQFMIDTFRDNNFFNNTDCVKIPLGVEFESNRTVKNYDTIDITYIGTLGKHKGVHTLITAFKQINNENIRLHIIGKGYDEEEFKKMGDTDDRIIFHGFVDNRDILKYYEMTNILVIPSICYDNSPLVIYESFSTGTPVIGSSIGGIPELITEGYNGFLFESGNSDSLKEKLVKVINDKELLKTLECNAFDSLPSDSMEIMISQIIREYDQLVEQ